MAKTIQEREAKDIQYGEYPKDMLENSLTEEQEKKPVLNRLKLVTSSVESTEA